MSDVNSVNIKHYFSCFGYIPEAATKKAATEKTNLQMGGVNLTGKSDPRVKSLATKTNIASALCWIPIIGSIIGGILRLATWGNVKPTTEKGRIIKRAQLTRAVFELTGMGFLFTVPDLIIYFGRKNSTSQQQQNHA